jgi:hypothetical protein
MKSDDVAVALAILAIIVSLAGTALQVVLFLQSKGLL